MKKILLFFFLIFPIFVNAVTYSSATTTAGNYMETGDYKYGYEKYIYTPTNSSSFYNNDASLFNKGGMLNLEEFRITLKNNTRSLYYSYLYEGNPYWTITSGSSSDYRKIVNSGYTEYKKTENSTKIGTKITEYVIPTTSVVGQGSYNDPFIFAPQYKVLIKVNNSERGVMVDEDNNEVTSIEFLATESDYREIKIKSKGKYGYIGSTCGLMLNDIQSSVGKLIVSGVSRDTECTINFGEKPTAVLLNQTENTTPSYPVKLFIIPENGWFSDEFANYTITTLTTNPTKTGYTYKGYYKSTSASDACDGTLVIGTDKKLIKTKSLLDSFVNNQTLYPCYTANTYTVTFDKNTGDRLTTTSKSVTFDQTYGELPVPEKDGYRFDGWYTDTVSGELIESSTLMDLATSHTLYAHWQALSNTEYKVKHWLQNVGGGTTENDTNYTENTTITHTGTSDTTVTAPRKTFTGFNQPSSKTVTIDRHGTSVVNYYYTRKYYDVTYNLLGIGSPQPSVATIQYQAAYPIPTVSATGYTFDGWYKDQSYTNEITSGETLTDASNHQLYARWIVNKYTITLNKSAGISAVSGAGTFDYNTVRNINATVQAGYTWSNWTGDLSTTTKAHSFNMPAKNITLTAVATGNPYSVLYNCNGGTGTRSATNHIYGTASSVSTNFCTKTGSTFTKWTTVADGSGTSVNSGGSVTNLTTSYNGTVTLYAQWSVNNYTVAYNCNGGTGSTASSSHTYGVYNTLTANGCSRTGHRFDGWTTNSDGTGTLYTDKESVVNLTSSNNATVTLYAKWTKCAAGTYLSGNTCATCPAGKYSTGGTNSCSTCPAGKYSAAGSGSCSTCAAGQYSAAGSGSCSTCSAGTYSAAGSSTCSACAAGKYSGAGAASCSTCTAGYYCPGGTNRKQCAAGTYSASGASSCSTCAAGTYSAAGATSCSSCSAGTYSAAGASSCTTCTAGYYCPGGTNRKQCTAGTYSSAGASSCTNCAAGKYSAAGASSCTNCAAGKYSTGGASSCSTCTAGYYCPGGTNRQQCSAGTYSAEGASSCTACSAGYYSAAGASSCTGCAAGKYSVAGASSCSTCTAGYRCPGSTNRIQCTGGTYSAAGASSCTNCSAGYYSGAGATSCSACAAGKYSSAGSSSCSNCSAGTYSSGGASSCTNCSAGTYSSAGASSCSNCPAGKYSAAGASSCSTCTAGYYCSGGSNRVACAAGYYSAAGASSCTKCPAGQYNTGTGNTACSSCPAGYYCSGGSNKVACAAGTYSTGGASSCTTCTAGYYCPGGSNRIQCGSGYTSSAGASSCTASYTVKTGVAGSITGGSNYRNPYRNSYASSGWMSTMKGFLGRNGTYNYSYIVTFKTPGATNDVTEKLTFKWWVASVGSTFSSETYRYAIASSTANKGSYANATGSVSDSYQLVQGSFTWYNVYAASGTANYQTLTINTTALKGGTTYYLYLWPSGSGNVCALQEANYSLSVNYRDY